MRVCVAVTLTVHDRRSRGVAEQPRRRNMDKNARAVLGLDVTGLAGIGVGSDVAV